MISLIACATAQYSLNFEHSNSKSSLKSDDKIQCALCDYSWVVAGGVTTPVRGDSKCRDNPDESHFREFPKEGSYQLSDGSSIKVLSVSRFTLTVTIRTGSGEPMTPISAIIASIATSYSKNVSRDSRKSKFQTPVNRKCTPETKILYASTGQMNDITCCSRIINTLGSTEPSRMGGQLFGIVTVKLV